MRSARKPIIALGLSVTRADAENSCEPICGEAGHPCHPHTDGERIISEESPYYAGVLFHALSDQVAQTHGESDLVSLLATM